MNTAIALVTTASTSVDDNDRSIDNDDNTNTTNNSNNTSLLNHATLYNVPSVTMIQTPCQIDKLWSISSSGSGMI